MQVVIDIPDGYIGVVMANQRTEGTAMDKLLRQAVIDGTPLPKCHGRLIDADSLINAIEEKEKRLSNADTIYGLCRAAALIFDESTIIEAEREEEK